MLKIENLQVSAGDAEILHGIDLEVQPGELHAIMGPNGSGKSTLTHVLGGKDGFEVTAGSVLFQGKNLLEMAPEIRAREGLFIGFQYPVEIPGVSNMYFLKAAVNAVRQHQGLAPLDAMDFMKLAKDRMQVVELDPKLAARPINEGFSGGEKKRNEIFQMLMLEPKLAVLDETDSGLDIDALKVVSQGINALRSPDRAMLVITHYQRLLHYVVPDRVHVLMEGRIVRSGGKELAEELEARGYDWLREDKGTAPGAAAS